jgi:lipopolysaccharide transport system ATP-binding protein
MYPQTSIKAENLSKCYQIYEHPKDRLRQFVLPRLQRLANAQPKQYYREFWALKGVSFAVTKGETVGIIGRNGSGKSTLLQLICGTLNPSSGSITTHGRIAALLELGSGFNPEFTGRENVYLNASVLGLNRSETESRFNDIETFADIGGFIDQPVKTYSSGMMVRLAFAVLAHVDPQILIIDEALAVGDAFFTQKCMRFIREFQLGGGTLLFVSHDTGALRSLCNRAIWLEKGEVVQEGSPKEISELYLEAFYEEKQGKGTHTRMRAIEKHDPTRPLKDQRLSFINSTNLRNDLKIFSFDPDSPSFGAGGAQIVMAQFLGEDQHPLSWVVGGELVTLSVQAHALQPLSAPIIGFTIKDRLGQALFGDNTYLSYRRQDMACDAGCEIRANFKFQMPILPMGDYSVNVAIADGTQEDHIQHHWMHDAVVFRSESTSVSTGLIGIPMQEIHLSTSGIAS